MPFVRRLAELGAWLTATRPVWHGQPLKERDLPWLDTHPDVAAWCVGLTPDVLERYERDPTDHPDCPPTLRHWTAESGRLAALPAHGAVPLAWTPEDTRWVPARKWGQLTRFVGTLVPLVEDVPHVVDWCSGKGHLGRALAHWTGTTVVGVERQPALCQAGSAMAQRRGLPLTLQCADVLAPEVALPPVAGGGLVALHACGPLTDAAMGHGHDGGARLLAVSPCCLQSLGDQGYVPRSRAGQGPGLVLARSDLYLAMGEERIATPKLQRRRRTELAFRAGLDGILREVLGRTGWTSFRSVPRRTWDGTFADFCHGTDARYQLGLPARLDLGAWEAWGWRRSREARALSMARGCFRRALEVWAALDRAQHLAERGWQVQLGTFCDVDTTPRNLLIVARR